METLSLAEVAHFTTLAGPIEDAHVATPRHRGSRYVSYLVPTPVEGETCTISASCGVRFEIPFSLTFHADLAQIGVFLNDHNDSPVAIDALAACSRGKMAAQDALVQILAARGTPLAVNSAELCQACGSRSEQGACGYMLTPKCI